VTETPAPSAIDPRVERTRSVVLAATRDLLAEVGVDRTCIELVAERSGVARSTIYRHWENKPVLVMDALEKMRLPDDDDLSGDDEADVRRCLAELGEVLRAPNSSILADLAAATDRDPELAALHRNYVERKRGRVLRLIGRLQDADRLDPSLEPGYVADLAAGPLFYRRFNVGTPMSADEVDAHLDELLRRLAP
jgi:AcrR family transcriptional regulator